MTVTVTSALAGPATARYSNVYGALANLGLVSSLGAQDVTGSGDPVAPILNASEFYAPLTHSLILTRGTGNPTYSRATNAWEFGNDGYLKLVPSGAARFGGARFVKNFASNSEVIPANTRSNVTADAINSPIGTLTADKLYNDNTAANSHGTKWIVGDPLGAGTYRVSIYAKAGEYTKLQIRCTVDPASGNHQYGVLFDLSAGTVLDSRTILGSTTSTGQSITAVGDGWYRCEVMQGNPSGLRFDVTINLVLNTATTVLQNPTHDGDGASGVYLWGLQVENVTGQADQTASEYVSVGVLSAPYHGAGVDGCKWFNTNKDGSAISASSLLGYHAEGARTNSLLWSRDLRQGSKWSQTVTVGSELCSNGTFGDATGWTLGSGWAVTGGELVGTAVGSWVAASIPITWVVGKFYVISFTATVTSGVIYPFISNAGNLIAPISASGTYTIFGKATATGDLGFVNNAGTFTGTIDNISIKEAAIQVSTCTGIDNAANSASTLTAGAANATILQTLTLAAAARSFSAYVKRRTGTGNVYITRDGGTNWTDITSEINSSTWTRVKIENTSVLNPSVGFKIATSGDAIDVDVCQDEAGIAATSPIITTTAAVTRNADALTYSTANVDATKGAAKVTTTLVNSQTGDLMQFVNLALYNTSRKPVIYDGTSAAGFFSEVMQAGVETKLASYWNVSTSEKNVAKDGVLAGAAATFDGTIAFATLAIGIGAETTGYIKETYIWKSALTDAQLQQVTT